MCLIYQIKTVKTTGGWARGQLETGFIAGTAQETSNEGRSPLETCGGGGPSLEVNDKAGGQELRRPAGLWSCCCSDSADCWRLVQCVEFSGM